MSDHGPVVGSKLGAAKLPPARRHEVLVVGREAPDRMTSGRWAHIKRLAGTRSYLWPAVLLGGGLFLLGSATGKAIFAVLPLLIVLGVLGVRLWREATRLAARDFFAGYAVSRGFNYSESMMLMATTPLLAAGERRRCEHYIEGALDGVEGTSVGLAHFVFETQERRRDRRNRPIPVFTPHDFTVAMVDLPRPSSVFPTLYLHRRSGILSRTEWLEREGLIPATLENQQLAKRCELIVSPDQDRERLRALMRADLQRWFAESPLSPGLEYVGGMLVLYVPGHLRGADQLDGIIDFTARVAQRLLVTGEPLKAVAPSDSQAPPRGVAAFPAPPPATKPKLEPALRIAPSPRAIAPPGRETTRASIPPPRS